MKVTTKEEENGDGDRLHLVRDQDPETLIDIIDTIEIKIIEMKEGDQDPEKDQQIPITEMEEEDRDLEKSH